MALVSFHDRRSFGEKLDRLVIDGRLTRTEADELELAPRVFIPLREVIGYLGGLIVLVGGVWTTSAALEAASPMSTAVLLYIAGAIVMTLALWMQTHFGRKENILGRRGGEVVELLGTAALVAAVAITLNELLTIRAEHLALWVAVPGLLWSFVRLGRSMFASTISACAAWIAVVAASVSLLDTGDTWSAVIFTLGGLVLFSFSLSKPPFSFAPSAAGVLMMIFSSNGINGTDSSVWLTLFPLAVAGLLFLCGAAGARIEVLLVSGVAVTVDVGIIAARTTDSDLVSGLVVTAIGALMLAASVYTVTSSRRSSPISSSSASTRTSLS
jgi:uncharacterized membrane protein